MEIWRSKHTSLELLTHVFGIPTPKMTSGSQVARIYYEEKDLERIVAYCEKDVVATVQFMLRYLGRPLMVLIILNMPKLH